MISSSSIAPRGVAVLALECSALPQHLDADAPACDNAGKHLAKGAYSSVLAANF